MRPEYILLLFVLVSLYVLYIVFWQNRSSQWEDVATLNGITYRQHKKYRNRRSWVYKVNSYRLSERDIRWDWLDNKVDKF